MGMTFSCLGRGCYKISNAETGNTRRTGRNCLQNNDNVNKVVNDGQTQHIYNVLLSPGQ
jgi:hypothetical protein